MRMRPFFYPLLFLLLCLLTPGRLLAQQYNFRNYSVAEGLPQSQVYAMIEDRRGYLWFGTRGGGICRFDGIQFNTLSEQDGLPGNYVRSLLEDQQGNIWIGTDDGLSCYDGRKFRNFNTSNGLGDNTVSTILQDRQGRLWMGGDNGSLTMYDGKSFSILTKKDGLTGAKITCLFEDRNDLWIGTENGLLRRNGNSMIRYSTQQGLCSNILRSIARDRSGNLWFASYTGGVSKFDGQNFVTYNQSNGLAGNTVLSVLADKKGNLWFGTAGGGISRFDGYSFSTYTETEGLCNNVVICILQDSQGNLWFGSSGGGVSRFDNGRFVHFTRNSSGMSGMVYAIHQDTAGNMWFASSDGGITKYDGKVYHTFRASEGFTNSKVRCIFQDDHYNLWFGTLGDWAYRYDGEHFERFTRKDGLCGNFINSISGDTVGNIWFATAGGGLCMIPSPYNKESRYRSKDFGLRSGLGADRLFAILADQRGSIWAGTSGNGLVRIRIMPDSSFQLSNYRLKEGFPGTTVRSIVMDKDGNLWTGTAGSGIVKIIPAGRPVFIPFTKKEGLSSNNIYLLVPDADGNLWAGTEKGVDRLSFDEKGRLKAVKHYGMAEGFSGIETVQNAGLLDKDGCLWFGTVNGTTRYNPREDQANPDPPRMQLTSIKLFFTKLEETPFGKNFSKWSAVPQKLVLPYTQNHLSFDFIGINLHNPEGVQYRWILEGFDRDWSPVNTNRTATYSNLPPGEYIFKVMARNEDGVWTREPAEVHFSIASPYWATLWFRGSAGGTGLALFLMLFQLRVRRIRRKNEAERRKIEMEKNMAELEQQALLLQMNPHFIFNALNSIQGYITRNDPVPAKKYLAKFARLMRQILENSTENHVPLEQEIEMLTNYLELEKLCHPGRFEYVFIVEERIDPAALMIPPMLIQPFIENAILHGILPEDKEGSIRISFSMKEDRLLCTITDNGIGIQKSLRNREDEESAHKSKAYLVTEKRLSLMKQAGAMPARISISDLSEEGGKGTRVELEVPCCD